MRLSDLIGAEVVDADGARLGAVRDVRLVQDGPVQGPFGAGLRVAGLIVGPTAVASRLGYDRREMRGPWPVAALARHLSRHARHVEWEAVAEVRDRVVTLTRRTGELAPPALISHGRILP